MRPLFFPFLVITFSFVQGKSENKRNAALDSSKNLPIISGGGLLASKSGARIPRDTRLRTPRSGSDWEGESELLLEATPLPDSYVFLSDPKYEKCFANVDVSQGSCNTCWAFAVQKMLQARSCKWRADQGDEKPFVELYPLNLVCKVQEKRDGVGVCDARSVADALEYAKEQGVLKHSFVLEWTLDTDTVVEKPRPLPETLDQALERRRAENRNASIRAAVKQMYPQQEKYNLVMEIPSRFENMMTKAVIADITKPSEENCEVIFRNQRDLSESVVKAPRIFASSAPYSATNVMRYLHKGGPVIGTLRLSWDFINHSGSLFHPRGRQVFCRMYRAGDPEDFCDPRRSAEWDQEQRDQQWAPTAEAREAQMESWYNHFVVLHGWGRTAPSEQGARGVMYWVVENSWGQMYTNDASLGNNGAGAGFTGDGLNMFTLIADEVAGRGGLEITTREVYFASK